MPLHLPQRCSSLQAPENTCMRRKDTFCPRNKPLAPPRNSKSADVHPGNVIRQVVAINSISSSTSALLDGIRLIRDHSGLLVHREEGEWKADVKSLFKWFAFYLLNRIIPRIYTEDKTQEQDYLPSPFTFISQFSVNIRWHMDKFAVLSTSTHEAECALRNLALTH